MMRCRPSARRGAARRPRRPRSLLRRLLDYGAGRRDPRPAGRCVAARLDRVETRKISGDAIVNDGDSITLKGERIRLRGIDAPEYNQTCRKDGADYPCGRALARGAGRGWSAGGRDRLRRLGARPLRPAARRLHGRRRRAQPAAGRGGLGGRLWRLCRRRAGRARERGAGLWAGSFERPRDWRVEHGGMAESEHDLFGRDAQLAAGDLRLFMTRACAVVRDERRKHDETVRWRPRAEPAPGAHLPGREGHFGAAGAGRHGARSSTSRKRSARAIRCGGCRCWNSTTAPSSPRPSRSAAISRSCSPSRRCSARGALGKALVEMWQRRMELNLFAAVAAAFRHIHPAMKEWEMPQVPEWGEANKPKAIDFLAHPRRASWQRANSPPATPFRSPTSPGWCALDFMKPARIAIPEELTNVLRWHQALRQPAECRRLSVSDRARRAGRRASAPAASAATRRSGRPLPHEPRPVLVPSSTAQHPDRQPGAGHQGASLRHARSPTRPATGCATGWASAATSSTIRDCSPSCRWASAFPARTPRAPTCRRAANARRPGARR